MEDFQKYLMKFKKLGTASDCKQALDNIDTLKEKAFAKQRVVFKKILKYTG